MTAQPERASRAPIGTLFLLALISAAIAWSYWPTLAKLAERWGSDPQYSHGWLVPAFAAYYLWLRRDSLRSSSNLNLFGLLVIGGALVLRLVGARFHFDYFDQVSLLPLLAGFFLLIGGRAMFTWSLPAVAFLVFMIPLPHRVSLSLSGPMQSFATAVSTFALQTLGKPALAEGNVILLNDIELGIVEACSGLRMLVVFFALSSAVALMIKKPLWEKLFIAASALPIALASNVIRITITGLFYEAFGAHFGGAFFHDLAGWLMMPLGLAFLGIEMWILGKLLIEQPQSAPTSATIDLQRTEPNAVAMYRVTTTPRREKSPKSAEPVTEDAALEPVEQG